MGEKDNKINLEKMDKKIAILLGIIGLLSVFNLEICRFISIGRVEYFDFDMEYYDYSLNYVSKGIWFIFVGTVIGGVVSAVLLIALGLYLKKKNEDKARKYGVFYWIISTLVVGILIFLFSKHFASNNKLGMIIGVFTTEIFVAIYCTVFSLVEINNNLYVIVKIFLTISIIVLILIGFTALWLKNDEYKNAMEQKTFEIIKKDVDIGGKKYQYVVISSSPERYSAYLCEFIKKNNGIELNIVKNAHKYFLINEVETYQLEFSEIKKDDKLSYADIE